MLLSITTAKIIKNNTKLTLKNDIDITFLTNTFSEREQLILICQDLISVNRVFFCRFFVHFCFLG